MERAQAEARQPFDLAQGPLLRASLLRLGPEEHVLLLTIHHIVFDGGSVGIFLDELARRGRTIAYDRRGFSRSERPEPFVTSVRQHADDAAYWENIWYWSTPQESCADDDDATTCVTQDDWVEAWTTLRGG